jgi:hypothetical protein
VLPDFPVPSAEGLSAYTTIFLLFISNSFTRRLKLRCDRGIPCGSCLKRGCGAICPDGTYYLDQCTASAHHLLRFAHHRTGQSVSSKQHLSLQLAHPFATLSVDSYLHPPKSCMRRSRSCVLVSEISKMHSELRIARTRASLIRFFLMSCSVSRLLYNARAPPEARRS